MASTLTAAKHSFIISNPDLFPDYDGTMVDTVETYTDEAIASLKDGESAIIVECYSNPDLSRTEIFDNGDICYEIFAEICEDLEAISSSVPGSKIEYPYGLNFYDEILQENVFDPGNVMIVVVNGHRNAKYTMINRK